MVVVVGLLVPMSWVTRTSGGTIIVEKCMQVKEQNTHCHPDNNTKTHFATLKQTVWPQRKRVMNVSVMENVIIL